MEIMTLRVDQIDAVSRLRAVDDDYARMIGVNMAQNGQSQPIVVRPSASGRYRLIDGAHRHRGAQLADPPMETIHAIVRSMSDDEADLAEIDANLVRHDLNELDRCEFHFKRQKIWGRLHPEGAKSKRGVNDDKFVVLMRTYSKAAAEKLGVSQRTVQRMIERAQHISKDVKSLLAGTPYANSGVTLEALAKLDGARQLEVAQRLVEHWRSEGEPLPVAAAKKAVDGVVVARDEAAEAEKLYYKIKRLYDGAPAHIKQSFCTYLRSVEQAEKRAARDAA